MYLIKLQKLFGDEWRSLQQRKVTDETREIDSGIEDLAYQMKKQIAFDPDAILALQIEKQKD